MATLQLRQFKFQLIFINPYTIEGKMRTKDCTGGFLLLALKDNFQICKQK